METFNVVIIGIKKLSHGSRKILLWIVFNLSVVFVF